MKNMESIVGEAIIYNGTFIENGRVWGVKHESTTITWASDGMELFSFQNMAGEDHMMTYEEFEDYFWLTNTVAYHYANQNWIEEERQIKGENDMKKNFEELMGSNFLCVEDVVLFGETLFGKGDRMILLAADDGQKEVTILMDETGKIFVTVSYQYFQNHFVPEKEESLTI